MSKIYRFTSITVLLVSMLFSGAAQASARQVHTIGYTIQAGAFKEQQRAEKLTEKLRTQKLEVAYYKKDNGLFAVSFGDFPSWDAAAQEAKRLKGEGSIDSYYIVRPAAGNAFYNYSGNNVMSKLHDADRGRLAARTAERFTGIQYKYGGNNVVEGLDCSAFVKSVYYLIGLDIPRTSQEQFNAGDPVERSNLKEGDLLFFGKGPERISHVGMYIGNGKFIHAPRRGEPIQITPVNNEKYVQKYVGSRRFL